MRVLRQLLPFLVVLLIVGALALVLSSRPQLEDARDEVDARWRAVAAPLSARYELLAAASTAARANTGPAGAVAAEVDTALAAWAEARDGEVAGAVDAANDLEGLGRRLVAAVAASPALAGDPAVQAAIAGFATAAPPEPATPFVTAVRAYEDERDGPLRGVVAEALGYDAIPVLVMAAPPAPQT